MALGESLTRIESKHFRNFSIDDNNVYFCVISVMFTFIKYFILKFILRFQLKILLNAKEIITDLKIKFMSFIICSYFQFLLKKKTIIGMGTSVT